MRCTARLLAIALALGAMQTARAADPQAPSPADASAIRRVIQQQLDAFRKDDAAAAFAEASPGIQALFGDDPGTFLDMVRRSYQPVYHPRSTTFGTISVQDGRVVQKLETVTPDGGGHEALYFMQHEPDGTWLIDGCVLTDSGSVGA
jgi:hypothetical protein